MSGWSDGQVREFARRFARSHRACWPAYVPTVREALIDSFVLLVVLGQDRSDVAVEEVRSVRSRLGACLSRSGMPNPVGDEVAEAAVSSDLDRDGGGGENDP